MNRIAISEIAWHPHEQKAALGILRSLGVQILEAVPGRLFENVATASAQDIALKRRLFEENGFSIASLQAVLYGKDQLLLFDASTRPLLLDHLRRIAEVASLLGAKTIVFGAPRNRRIPPAMSQLEAWDIATAFFAQLGRMAREHEVVFGIEAVPPVYGSNFCTSSTETARLVHAVAEPSIAWHVDTGTMALTGEDPTQVILDHADIIRSVHISQPHLSDFENPWDGHKQTAASLQSCNYSGNFTIEMKPSGNGLSAIEQAVNFARNCYPCQRALTTMF